MQFSRAAVRVISEQLTAGYALAVDDVVANHEAEFAHWDEVQRDSTLYDS